MSSHLSSEQLSTLAGHMRERYARLQQEVHDHLIDSGDENYIEVAGRVHDRGDEAVADMVAELNYNIINTQVAEMRAIEEALTKIDERTYGTCTDCGINIPFARLQASPTALRCVKCQQAIEDNLKRTAHP